MLVATLLFSLVCIATFLFARATATRDYRSFFRELLGPGWIAFEAVYILFVVLILAVYGAAAGEIARALDRKSTRLNSSHANISYAVFCLKKKKKINKHK